MMKFGKKIKSDPNFAENMAKIKACAGLRIVCSSISNNYSEYFQ